MILVKINEGVIEKFPYSLSDLRAEYPTKSFPAEPSSDVLAKFSVYPVFYHPFPMYDQRTQIVDVAQTPVLIDDVWTVTRNVIDKSAEEIAEYDRVELTNLRKRRFDEIDEKTSTLIETGWIYLSRRIRLNAEDQNNYEGEYVMNKEVIADGVPAEYVFPTIFKVWTQEDGTAEFFSFDNLDQMKSFIYSGKIHIKKCLTDGWNLKESVRVMPIDQLRAWVDVR